MSDLTRREFLKFIGATSATTLTPLAMISEAQASGFLFTPVRTPHPLPVYTAHPSWYATGAERRRQEVASNQVGGAR